MPAAKTDTLSLERFQISGGELEVQGLRKKIAVGFLLLNCILVSIHQGGFAAERVDLIVRGGTVVTMDGSSRVIENGAVAI